MTVNIAQHCISISLLLLYGPRSRSEESCSYEWVISLIVARLALLTNVQIS